MKHARTRNLLFSAIILCTIPTVNGGVIFGFSDSLLGGGYRWDAAARNVNIGGTSYERSLVGGLAFVIEREAPDADPFEL
jgi:hypothetical protein